MEENKCKHCLAQNGHHHPDCDAIPLDEAKAQLKLYYKAWLEKEKKHRSAQERLQKMVNKAYKEAEFWKGKFNIIKIENNALRKKKST